MTKFYEIDNDCCQHIRHDDESNWYEMIQIVWLDTTEADRAEGAHEYIVVAGSIEIADYTEDEIAGYISSYGYTIDSLNKEYGEAATDIIAECILEEEILRDQDIVFESDSYEECEKYIKNYICKFDE